MNIVLKELFVEIGNVSIINDVSFDVPDKSFTCLVGPNGSGKTTILKAIVGEITEYRGYISEAVLGKLSYLPQNLEVPPFLSVLDVVRTGFYGRPGTKLGVLESVDDLLYQCGIYPLREMTFADISVGEQQRTWLAFALAQDRGLILMDEPLSSVDIESRRGFYRLLKDVNQTDKTLLVVTHDIDMVMEFADKIIYLDGGIKKFEGAPNAFSQWYR